MCRLAGERPPTPPMECWQCDTSMSTSTHALEMRRHGLSTCSSMRVYGSQKRGRLGGRSFSLRSAHVARMAIAGPGWTLHRTDVAVHLSAARARISHVCLQAGPPSSVSPGVLLAYRWTIRAGHRLMLAAGCTLIYPTDTGSKPQPVAGARRVQLPGGRGEQNGFFGGQWSTQGGAQCHLQPSRTPHALARTTLVYLL